jgi:hypothetical protein
MDTKVIARSSRGEPLVRTLLWRRGRYVGLRNPTCPESQETGRTASVGFPIEDVFPYKSATYIHLRQLWQMNVHDALAEGWSELEHMT